MFRLFHKAIFRLWHVIVLIIVSTKRLADLKNLQQDIHVNNCQYLLSTQHVTSALLH